MTKNWVVEAYTPMGIMTFLPKHETKEQAEKHKARLEKEQPGVHFGVFDETLKEERRKAMES